MPTFKLSERPAKIVLAVRILYLVVGIGIIRTAMTVMRHAEVRSPDFLIIAKILIYAASLFLIYQVSKGKNWARWSLVVILSISIFLLFLPAVDAFSHNPVHTLLVFLQYTLYIVALLLLFHRKSSGWFVSGKVPRNQ